MCGVDGLPFCLSALRCLVEQRLASRLAALPVAGASAALRLAVVSTVENSLPKSNMTRENDLAGIATIWILY